MSDAALHNLAPGLIPLLPTPHQLTRPILLLYIAAGSTDKAHKSSIFALKAASTHTALPALALPLPAACPGLSLF